MPGTESMSQAEAAKEAIAGMEAGKAVIEQKEPVEYPTLLYTIVARDANAAIKWYEKALDAKTLFLYHDKEGRVMHSVLQTKYGMMFGVEDHYPGVHMVTPAGEGEVSGAASGSSYVYISIPAGKGSADEAVERMREHGATVVRECQDMFYGHRVGNVVDSYGVGWTFGHKIEKKDDDKPAE